MKKQKTDLLNEIKLDKYICFSDWATYYLQVFDKDADEFSRYAVEKNFEKNVYPKIGEKSLCNITEADVQNLLNACSENMQHNSVWAIFRKIRQMLSKAVELKLIKENPCSTFSDFRYIPIEQRPFTDDELRVLKEAIDLSDLKYLYRMAFACGIRKNEMLILRWSDIDMEKRIISVRAFVKIGDFPHGVRDISAKHIQYYINDDVKKVLAAVKNEQSCSIIGNPEGLVFQNDLGGVISRYAIEKSLRRIRDLSGVEDFNFRRITAHVQLTGKSCIFVD